MKYTQGPWTYYTSPQPNGCPIVGARGLMVAQLAHSVNEKTQSETAIANAQLIAAAPELLEALEKIIEMNVDYALHKYGDSLQAESMACVKVARAAIAKAKGEAP